jgi:hypothetical protein
MANKTKNDEKALLAGREKKKDEPTEVVRSGRCGCGCGYMIGSIGYRTVHGVEDIKKH